MTVPGLVDGTPSATVKRSVDVLVGSALLLAAVVPLGVAMLLVAVRLGRPVLFRQERLGQHGEPFTMVKLRTMHHADPARGLVTDADRLTRLGRFLRASSLDELPGLVNVLRGEMSLVGPRPLPTTYRERFTPAERRRHEMRPGLTGLAQVSGRNALGWEERFRLDVEYVDRWSLLLDLRILVRTAVVVTTAHGVRAVDCATMHELRPETSTR